MCEACVKEELASAWGRGPPSFRAGFASGISLGKFSSFLQLHSACGIPCVNAPNGCGVHPYGLGIFRLSSMQANHRCMDGVHRKLSVVRCIAHGYTSRAGTPTTRLHRNP